jgi:hypothetical protein
MIMANQSRIRNCVTILDSCHRGVAGGTALQQKVTEISDGVTILTASTAEQYANEEDGAGVRTKLLVDALGGSAANLVGDVTTPEKARRQQLSIGKEARVLSPPRLAFVLGQIVAVLF